MHPSQRSLDTLSVREMVAAQLAAGLARSLPGPHVEHLAHHSGQEVPAEHLAAVEAIRAPWRAWLRAEALTLADGLLADLAGSVEQAAPLVEQARNLLETASVQAWLNGDDRPDIIDMAARDNVKRALALLRRACDLIQH